MEMKVRNQLVNRERDPLFFLLFKKFGEFGYLEDMLMAHPSSNEVRRLAVKLGIRLNYKGETLFFLCSKMEEIKLIDKSVRHKLLELGRAGEKEFQKALKRRKMDK